MVEIYAREQFTSYIPWDKWCEVNAYKENIPYHETLEIICNKHYTVMDIEVDSFGRIFAGCEECQDELYE